MQRTVYLFEKEDFGITIQKLPIWFIEEDSTGDKDNGSITFRTQNNYDDIWGPIGRFEISWEHKERTQILHAKEVQQSIDMYNAIRIVVTKKETIWVRSHEFTLWFGSRSKMVRKHYYPENVIHGVFYCEVSERIFNLHTALIREHYEGFKPYILGSYESVICH